MLEQYMFLEWMNEHVNQWMKGNIEKEKKSITDQ